MRSGRPKLLAEISSLISHTPPEILAEKENSQREHQLDLDDNMTYQCFCSHTHLFDLSVKESHVAAVIFVFVRTVHGGGVREFDGAFETIPGSGRERLIRGGTFHGQSSRCFLTCRKCADIP